MVTLTSKIMYTQRKISLLCDLINHYERVYESRYNEPNYSIDYWKSIEKLDELQKELVYYKNSLYITHFRFSPFYFMIFFKFLNYFWNIFY